MTLLLQKPRVELPGRTGDAAQREIRQCVRNLIGGLARPRRQADRRQELRYPYPRLVRLIPLDDATLALAEPRLLVVVGKQLSEQGFSFFHPGPLPHRKVRVEFERGDGSLLALALDIHWCRFTRHGWYESGGTFIGVLSDQPPGHDLPARPAD